MRINLENGSIVQEEYSDGSVLPGQSYNGEASIRIHRQIHNSPHFNSMPNESHYDIFSIYIPSWKISIEKNKPKGIVS
jgi:hypothetical protein